MDAHEVSRTLVKSPPELWAECSEASSLARHLGAFGEIRITRLEPETAVAWEGEDVRGTVRLEPSGWGTKVILTASPARSPATAVASRATAGPPPADESPPADEPPLVDAPPPVPRPSPLDAGTAPRRSLFGRIGRLLRPRRSAPIVLEPAVDAEGDWSSAEAPEAVPPEADSEARLTPESEPADVLRAALESLGAAHHRPFSRP